MDRTYFDPLSRGENVLPGLHAYSHVNALCSAARAYLLLGEIKYLEAIRNAWDMIEKTQSFASGGWAPNEEFVVPNKGLLGESLTKTHAHFETPCGSYAHFKLARYLLRFTGEARYGDGLERVLYNTILGVKDPKATGTSSITPTIILPRKKLTCMTSGPAAPAQLPRWWPTMPSALIFGARMESS